MDAPRLTSPVEVQTMKDPEADRPVNASQSSSPKCGDVAPNLDLARNFSLTIDSGGDQLATPQKNKGDSFSIPREVISYSLSSATLQLERSSPVIAGTYRSMPAYLVMLKLKLDVPGSASGSWLSRIQTASLRVVLEDAPLGQETTAKPARRWDRRPTTRRAESEASHPAIVKAFPENEGWKGNPSTAKVTSSKQLGLNVGWAELGANGSVDEARTWNDSGALSVTATRVGNERNCLIIRMTENPVTKKGVLPYLSTPMILTHHSRRFQMRATVNAKFGFWRGALSETVPVLGRNDDPLFFDPAVLQQAMDVNKLGTGGVRVVEWGGDLESVDLREHSSLIEGGSTQAT